MHKTLILLMILNLLWVNDDRIEYIFEVESTTSMTSALQRGSNVENDVKKIMLFPSDRLKQFERKMKAPMFNERFIGDNWQFILFEDFLKAWTKKKTKLVIDEIFPFWCKNNSSK